MPMPDFKTCREPYVNLPDPHDSEMPESMACRVILYLYAKA